jgi:hypothetical protein
MPQQSLVFLYQKFISESSKIETRFLTPLPKDEYDKVNCIPVHDYCAEMCVIRLHDAWSRFCRELVLLSAACRPLSASGRPVPLAPGISSKANVFAKLQKSHRKPPFWEPRWGDPSECIDASNVLRLSNRAEISLGLGLTPSPVDEVRRIRNFMAHRSKSTADYLREIAIMYHLQGWPIAAQLLHLTLPSGVALFSEWVSNLQYQARVTVQ